MAEEVFIPKFGQTVEEVTIVEWLAADGMSVQTGDELLRVETDKAIFTVEATASGILHRGPYKEGDVIPILTVVALIGKEDEQFSSNEQNSGLSIESLKKLPDAESVEMKNPSEDTQTRIFVSPRARRTARERNIPLENIIPTGAGGKRIIEKDVLSAANRKPKLTPLAQKLAQEAGLNIDSLAIDKERIKKEDILEVLKKAQKATDSEASEAISVERVPLKGVRAVIAEHMRTSVLATARVTLTMEVDASELVLLRSRLRDRYEGLWGFSPGYLDLIGKMVTTALLKYPYMNARFQQEFIEVYHTVNLGIAVDTERGLMVPVIRGAEKLSLRRFAERIRELANAARQGNISPDDLQGSTFTITNLGNYDIDVFTPIINYPEVAILGIGRIGERVVPYHNEIAIRSVVILSLVFDHRLVDGAPAARFLQEIKRLIEDPMSWLIESLGEED
ncbi:MAG: Dihydrolipoamide acetyltransferase component (E2) of acetoin dehydrogenase complex [Anaerolineae bacterium]|nr:MAG: Dihydrolipoamide acetyltransferase component (E2) of acetoin dehydrogenase complex [Anaerolineae bacterium]